MLCFFSVLRPVLEETHALLDTVSIYSYSLMYMFIHDCQTTYDHYVLITTFHFTHLACSNATHQLMTWTKAKDDAIMMIDS